MLNVLKLFHCIMWFLIVMYCERSRNDIFLYADTIHESRNSFVVLTGRKYKLETFNKKDQYAVKLFTVIKFTFCEIYN